MRVTSLRIYPVKSLAGLALDSVEVEPWGFAGDRRWALVDETGTKVTARKTFDLLGLRAEPADSGSVRIVDRAGESILVHPPAGDTAVVSEKAWNASAVRVPGESAAWLSERFGRSLGLVWQPDPTERPIPVVEGGRAGDSLSLADASPVLLASEASMAQLNSWIAGDSEREDVPGLDPDDFSDAHAPAPAFRPLDILRFRPSIVIDGTDAFAEDDWPALRIGEVVLRRTILAGRCVMTTIDPTTLARGKEPIRTLARHRRWDGTTWFGVRMAPMNIGALHVGDEVEPLESA